MRDLCRAPDAHREFRLRGSKSLLFVVVPLILALVLSTHRAIADDDANGHIKGIQVEPGVVRVLIDPAPPIKCSDKTGGFAVDLNNVLDAPVVVSMLLTARALNASIAIEHNGICIIGGKWEKIDGMWVK